MLGMARNAWGFARIGEIGERVWRTWIIYIFNQKNNDNKTERGTFGAINSPKNSKSRWEIQKKTTWIPRTIAKRRNYGNITGEQQYKKSNKENRWGKGDMNAPTHNP